MTTVALLARDAVPDEGWTTHAASPWRSALHALARDRSAMFGLGVLAALAIVALAGYAGGIVDVGLMRVVDALLAIPRVLLLIAVATLWNGLGITGLMLLLGLTGWFGVSRLVRTLVVSARED